jgi:hypothetical protein
MSLIVRSLCGDGDEERVAVALRAESSLKGWGFVKPAVVLFCPFSASVRAALDKGRAVKTERPQRSEDERS